MDERGLEEQGRAVLPGSVIRGTSSGLRIEPDNWPYETR